MHFTKMHGAGNDYVYVNCFEQDVPDPSALAERISDRHYGVGGDGLVLMMPDETAHVRMRMFNADGSEGRMCGNALRCLAKLVYERGIAPANPLEVQTASGVLRVELEVENGTVRASTADMGEPILAPARIPVDLPDERIVDRPFELAGTTYPMTCVSMGNPHAVFYVDDVAGVDLEQVGPLVERHRLFPDRVNAHFVQVRDDDEVIMRTWERGSGITLACGTGASAVCVAGVLTGRSGRAITAHLPGGDLRLRWDEQNNHVYLTGPAEEVFTGDWPDEKVCPPGGAATEKAKPCPISPRRRSNT